MRLLLLLMAAPACLPAAETPPHVDSGSYEAVPERCTAWRDRDRDGWGDADSVLTVECMGGIASDLEDGLVDRPGDCDDMSNSVHPDAPELCNDRDDNCDDRTDEDPVDGQTGWPDRDGDGHGDAGAPYTACVLPSTHVEAGGDCDDLDPDIHPDAADDQCDGIDDDCDGRVDGGLRVPEDWPDIQAALEQAANGGLVCVGPGTWEGGFSLEGKIVRLVGREGPERTVIDGRHEGPVIRLESNEPPDTLVEGFTLRGGEATVGAGLRIKGASPTLRNLVIRENRCLGDACTGTGLHVESGSPLIEDVRIEENRQQGHSLAGAGAALVYSEARLLRVQIRDNLQEGSGESSLQGAGLYLGPGSTIDLDAIELTGNRQVGIDVSSASLQGAGLCGIESSGSWQGLTISGNTQECSGDTCAAHGAGLYLHKGSPLLTASHLSGNEATVDAVHAWAFGGGLAMHSQGTSPVLQDVQVSGNTLHAPSGQAWGAGISIRSSSRLEATRLQVIANDGSAADAFGSALSVDGQSEVALENAILAGNTIDGQQASGAGIYLVQSSLELVQADVVGNLCTALACRGAAFVLHSESSLLLDGVNTSGNLVTHAEAGTGIEGGAIIALFEGNTVEPVFSNFHDNGAMPFSGVETPSFDDGNLFEEPLHRNTGSSDALLWDLSLRGSSLLIDAGNPARLDADGSRADIGALGGPGASGW